jgi:Fe-S cluster biogenesis protein NfuA
MAEVDARFGASAGRVGRRDVRIFFAKMLKCIGHRATYERTRPHVSHKEHFMRTFSQAISVVVVLGGVVGCPQSDGTTAQESMFTASLTGAQEVPAVTTGASGSGTFTLNEAKTALTFSITASGLSGAVTAAHFHSAPSGVSGGVVFDVGNFVQESGGQVTIDGTWNLAASDVASLEGGEIYINIHTAQNPAGEIRGQLVAP